MPSPPKLRAKDASHLSRELDEVRRREEELRKLEEEMKKRVEELPRKIAEHERKQQEMIRMRAVLTTTDDVLGRPRDKRHPSSRSSTGTRRRSRSEERTDKIKFFLLCAVLALFFFLLWKSVP